MPTKTTAVGLLAASRVWEGRRPRQAGVSRPESSKREAVIEMAAVCTCKGVSALRGGCHLGNRSNLVTGRAARLPAKVGEINRDRIMETPSAVGVAVKEGRDGRPTII